jgi:SAM-dependent methyltransferase
MEARVAGAAVAVRGRHYFGIFVVACAILAYQILITRFFSVVLYYHLAFAAISLAMLGLTIGAMTVYRQKARYAAERVDVEFAIHAAWFALSGVGAVIAFLYAALLVPTEYVLIAQIAVVTAFLLPFTQGGICITLLLTRLPGSDGRLYAADLAGAASGCVAIIGLLFVIDPVSATIWLAAGVGLAGWVCARGRDVRVVRLTSVVTVVLGAAAALHTGLYVTGNPHIGVFWAKGVRQTDTLYESWNTFSRVRVRPLGVSIPFGWSMAHPPQTRVDQDYLDIDADAATIITRMDGDLGKLSYLANDVINAAYLVQPTGAVAVVGVGGGRDILSALYFGAKRITGIEINPAIIDALTRKFGDFAGHLERQPGVSLVNAEARSYINGSADRYDLVQISLIDTWAATAAGGLTLTENRLYTVEAWEDFYRALKPGGLLSVSRWYHPVTYRSEFYRLVAIGAEALMRRGVPAAELSKHVIALNVGDIVTVITRPLALTMAEWQTARTALRAQGFNILLGPDIAFDNVTSTLLSDKANADFFAAQPENIAPSTDDKPFFFYTARLGDWFVNHETNSNLGVEIILVLLIVTLAAGIVYVVLPLRGLARQTPGDLARPLIYFSAIGIGFMLIEISEMERLMVFLGHPVYGLGVVLFSLLLFSGLGSATVGGAPGQPRSIWWRVSGLIGTLLLVGALTPAVTAAAKVASTDVRILISVLLLAPPAFFMGMMFPVGLNIWRRRHSEVLPFFWGVNGIFSVFASVLGMALSMQFGIADTYAAGVVAYGVCALMAIELAGRSFLAPGTDGSGLTGDRSAGALTAPLSFGEVPPPPARNR